MADNEKNESNISSENPSDTTPKEGYLEEALDQASEYLEINSSK